MSDEYVDINGLTARVPLADSVVMIIQADSRHIPLADKSVQCVVTSPPYWGLRDYGTAKWEGGDDGCLHGVMRSSSKSTLGLAKGQASHEAAMRRESECVVPYREQCGKCGATRIDNQIGLEKTPELYVADLVEVFREVWRVLKDDGTIWVNLGDSYAGSGKGNTKHGTVAGYKQSTNTGSLTGMPMVSWCHETVKAKDLVGIPWRVAFALQADGWYLRSDIIWSKPNPMPESVTDRPTKAHEYIFLMAKRERYYFDQDAVSEPASPNTHARLAQDVENEIGSARANGGGKTNGNMKAVFNHKMAVAGEGIRNNDSFSNAVCLRVDKRNIRTVWDIATQPYSEAHFATFPEELAARCIKAGTRAGDIVFDPFSGSATTIKVAQDLGRVGVGLELKWDYIQMARRRSAQQGFGLLLRYTGGGQNVQDFAAIDRLLGRAQS